MGKIKIQNELIEFKEKELKVDDLLFWEENPRVYSILTHIAAAFGEKLKDS